MPSSVTGVTRPVNNDLMDEDVLISEQKAYYRAIAPEYAVMFSPPGDPLAPFSRAIEMGLDRFRPAGRILEIASRSGVWTVRLLRHASSVTALDSSPEMHELARERTRSDPRVHYLLADVFSWQPDGRNDVVFFANWLSRVPHGRFTRFLGASPARRCGPHPTVRVFAVIVHEDDIPADAAASLLRTSSGAS
jgi:SAM-dependent methyltransferase